MKKASAILATIIETLTSVCGYLGALSIVAGAIIVTEGVIVRKVFSLSTIWQIEAAVFLLFASCLLGAPFAQRNDHHLSVDLVTTLLSKRARNKANIAVSTVSCLICGLIAWHSWPMWLHSLVENEHTGSLWDPPVWIPLFFLPFGMGLFCLQYIVYIVKKVRQMKTE